MNLSEYLSVLVQAYNPNKYEELLEYQTRTLIKFFLITLAFCCIIFTILAIPFTYSYIHTLPQKTSEMQQFALNANVQADHPITFLQRPSIILDLTANETSRGEFTFTNEGLLYPKYLFFGTGIMRWSDVRDLKERTPTRDNFLTGVVLFLLPSIIFWFFLYSLIKLGLVFILLVLLGYWLPRLFKHRITFKETVKLGLLTVPSVMIMDIGLYPLAPLFLWGLVLTGIFFFIGIAMISQVADDRHTQSIKATTHKR